MCSVPNQFSGNKEEEINMVSILEGVCPKCGRHYHVRILSNPEHKCDLCGSSLIIFQDGVPIGTDLSPFTAPVYQLGSGPKDDTIKNFIEVLNIRKRIYRN